MRWCSVDVKSKGGRPPSKNPRSIRIELRLTDAEQERLDWCVAHTGKNRSDIIRAGIDAVYERLQNEK